jgi:uncharacterized membrane protein HdeD (DUF308 family)
MEKIRFRNWWFLAVNGLIFIAFGLIILLFTQEFILTLVRWFGIFLLAGGAILLFLGINKVRKEKAATADLVQAIASIAIGFSVLLFTTESIKLFIMLLGVWGIILGVIQLVVVVNFKGDVKGKNVMLLNALFTAGLGVALLFNPYTWGMFLVKVVGVCAILLGLLMVYFSLVLRSVKNTTPVN